MSYQSLPSSPPPNGTSSGSYSGSGEVKQRWYQKKLLLIPIALLVGSCSGEPVANSSAAPTVTKTAPTVTKTAPTVTKTAPTVTETAPTVTETAPTVTETVSAPTPTSETVTKTVEKTPQSCLDALDAAGQGFGLASDFAKQTGRLIPLFPKTLRAGLNQDVQAIRDITDQIKDINSDLEATTTKIRQQAETLRPLAAECRAK